MKPKGIVIHCSATKDTSSKSWDAIRKFHKETNGWSDIGYHYGVELIGNRVEILQGRPITKAGAHTAGWNESIGICLVGDYDREAPDKAHMDKLIEITLDVLDMFQHLTPANVFPHNKFAPHKTCPGRAFPWQSFINEVWDQWKDRGV